MLGGGSRTPGRHVRTTWILATTAWILFMASPLAGAAQGCQARCTPQDVNGQETVDEDYVNVILYAHWLDVINRAPMNTQPPDELGMADINDGFQLPTVVADSPCEACSLNFRFNDLTLFTLPDQLDPVRPGRSVDASTQDPAYDLRLGDGPLELRFFLSAHHVPNQNSSTPSGSATNAGAVPAMRAEARWETGRHPYRGSVIAQGVSNIVTIINGPGGDPVQEVTVLMGRQMDVIPKGTGTVLAIRLYQVDEAGVEFMQSDWRLRSGPSYPWRLIVPVKNPLEAGTPEAWTYNETLHVRWGVRGAFGSYDVNDRSFELVARSPDGGEEKRFPPFQVERDPSHHGRLMPVKGYWILPYEALGGSDRWDLELRVENLQGTHTATAQAPVRLVTYQGENSTPGFEAGLLALALMGIVWTRTRRRRA